MTDTFESAKAGGRKINWKKKMSSQTLVMRVEMRGRVSLEKYLGSKTVRSWW